MGVGQKAIYNTTSTFNEVFQQHHPTVFNQLLTAIASPETAVAPLNNAAQVAVMAGDPATAAAIVAGGIQINIFFYSTYFFYSFFLLRFFVIKFFLLFRFKK
jgi:hypothetical protein